MHAHTPSLRACVRWVCLYSLLRGGSGGSRGSAPGGTLEGAGQTERSVIRPRVQEQWGLWSQNFHGWKIWWLFLALPDICCCKTVGVFYPKLQMREWLTRGLTDWDDFISHGLCKGAHNQRTVGIGHMTNTLHHKIPVTSNWMSHDQHIQFPPSETPVLLPR